MPGRMGNWALCILDFRMQILDFLHCESKAFFLCLKVIFYMPGRMGNCVAHQAGCEDRKKPTWVGPCFDQVDGQAASAHPTMLHTF